MSKPAGTGEYTSTEKMRNVRFNIQKYLTQYRFRTLSENIVTAIDVDPDMKARASIYWGYFTS
jgi:hypothetical protein